MERPEKRLDDSASEENAVVDAADIVDPPPAADALESELTEGRPPITIVDVEHEVGVDEAAEKVASDIKENADQIKAMLKTESAARQVEAQIAAEDKRVVEISKTVAEIAADVLKFAVGAVKSTVRARMQRENVIVDAQERSDAIASQVGAEEAANAPVENINLTDGPNPQVEGLPKPGETEFTGIVDDLTKIDRIGFRMAAALKAAGYDTFARLADASEDELRDAIHAAGLRLAPNLSTWAEQAALAEQGEWEKLREYHQTLRDRRRVTM